MRTRTNKRWTMTDIAYLKLMVQAVSVRVIAAEMGLKESTVTGAIRRFKIKPSDYLHSWENNICAKCGVVKASKEWRGQYTNGRTAAYSYDGFENTVFGAPRCKGSL